MMRGVQVAGTAHAAKRGHRELMTVSPLAASQGGEWPGALFFASVHLELTTLRLQPGARGAESVPTAAMHVSGELRPGTWTITAFCTGHSQKCGAS